MTFKTVMGQRFKLKIVFTQEYGSLKSIDRKAVKEKPASEQEGSLEVQKKGASDEYSFENFDLGKGTIVEKKARLAKYLQHLTTGKNQAYKDCFKVINEIHLKRKIMRYEVNKRAFDNFETAE